MAEELEEKSSKGGFDLPRYLGVVRRRHLAFLIPLLLGWLVVWGASWFLPSRYRSTTLILVEQPTMPKDYVTPNVNDDLQDRLRSITQQILSRTRLLHIIDQLNLYADPRGHLTPDEKVESMRSQVEIELVRDPQNRVSAFNVSYTSTDPQLAQRVTSELTNLFISENIEVRQQQSEGTTKFLESQLEAARKTLSDQEEKIREFKGQHVGEMPAQVASNLQILAGLQSQLQNDEDALNSAKQQRVYLETLLNQYRAQQGSPKSESGAPVGLPALDAELDKLRAQLADLSSHYTDRHPDVRKLKDQIARTEKIDESKEFAQDVQDSLSKRIQKSAKTVKNRGVRKAPFVVLIGADMPSILTEISFLSNPADEQLLKKPEQRQHVAEGIFSGVSNYLESLNSVALNQPGKPARPRAAAAALEQSSNQK